MFGNPSDKPTNTPNNNPSTGLFGTNSSNPQNKPPQTSLFGSTTAGLFGSTTPTTGGLFGSTNAPSGGLFANTTAPTGGLFGSSTPTTGGLFGASTTTMKTTQRKQGGLFGSVNTPKPTENQQAPKPLYTASGQSGLFGTTSAANTQNKQQNKPNTGSLFGNHTGSLFANTNSTPSSSGLFSGTPATTTPKEDDKKPALSGGLFSANTQDKKQNPQKNQKPALSFGNTSGSMFGNTPSPTFGDKKQAPGLFGSSGSSLLSGQNNSLFGGLNKKQEEKKQSTPLVQSKTPTTPLFGQKTTTENPQQQKPAFSLTGGLGSTSTGSSGLFGKKQTEPKPIDAKKIQTTQKQDKPATSSLFGSSQPKDQGTKTTAAPAFGSGGLFGAPKVDTKPSQTSGLFSNDKKQGAPLFSGGLFGSKNQQTKPKEAPVSSGLFSGNSSLFNNKTPQNQDKAETKKVQVPPQLGKAPQNLLATFSKQQIQNSPIPTAQNAQKRTNRTISFNQPLNQPTQTSATAPQNQVKPPTTTGLFSTNQSTTVNDKKPAQKSTSGITMTQSFVKPSTTGQTSTVPPTSNLSKSQRMMQQTFFKPAQIPKKQVPFLTIWTALEINNLLKEQIMRKSQGPPSRIGQKSTKNFNRNIEEWIEESFKRFNQIPTTEMLQKKYTLHSNEDINRFLNDIVREVVLVTNLPLQEKSFQLINKLFFELLDKLGIKEYLFSCTKVQIPENAAKNLPPSLQIVQLNINYFTKHQIYKFTPDGIHLNLDSEELQKYLLTLTKKFITNQLEYLEYIQNKPDLLKLPSQLFYRLFAYCLQYKKIRLNQFNVWKNKNPELIALVQDFEKKIITKIINLLSGFVESTFYDFLLINKQYLHEFIQLVQNFSYTQEEDIIHLSLKVILNNLGIGTSNVSGKQELQLSPQLISLIKETKSLQLLPFRTLAAILENKGYRTSPSAHDLYRYINGPEWLQWLQIYLGNSSAEKQISVHEARYIIKILKYPVATTKRMSREKLSTKEGRYMQSIESKVLNRKKPIYKYIISLKEENMLNIFYQILMSIIYDYESYRKIQELFFRQKDEFNYEFRNVIAEICNYPTQKLKQQIPFLQQKVLYFLRIVEVAPERTLTLQKLVFQGTPQTLKHAQSKQQDLRDHSDFSEVGHKICHLIIDTINYFGLKNDQKIVAKCISAVKSLLQNQQTSLPMKIAMAVNKPEMLFISSSLLIPNQYRLIDSLVIDMTELLEFMLISQEFSQTLALSLYTNNSEDVHLERMYSVRYSSKDYLPFARELTKNHVENKSLSKNLQEDSKITVTFSSYWILKCLQVFVQGIRQERTTGSSYGKNLLYMLSLILEKFFIPISHDVEFQEMSAKMMEETILRVNNPIYSNSSSNEIPKVLLYLAEALNTVDIMSILSQNLKYKLLTTGKVMQSKAHIRAVKYCLANEKLQDDFQENQFVVYLTVRILKQILQVYRVYEQFKHAPLKPNNGSLQSAQNHFVYKLLTRFKWIQDIEFNLFLKGFSKTDLLEQEKNSTTNLIIGLITLLMIDSRTHQKSNNLVDQIFESTPLNLKQHNYRKPFVVPIESSASLSRKSSNQLSSFAQVQNFYTKFGQTLNFEAINNFLVNPTNAYSESYESLQCLVMQSLGLMVSGQGLFGTRACNTMNESTINIAKFVGFYNNMDLSSEVFSNMWMLESFENQLYGFLVSENTSIQLKQGVLDFLYQVIKSQKSGNNFIIAKKVFYRYLVRHLDKFSVYSEEEINRLNKIVISILNVLEERDYFIMRKYCNDRLLDELIGSMLKSTQKCLKSTGNLIKLIKSFNFKVYYPSEFAYYHLERTYQQRQIIKTGQAFEILKGIIELIEKRFFDVTDSENQQQAGHKWKCIRKINSLIITLNLPFIASTIHDSKLSQLSIKHIHQQQTNKYYFNTNLPHTFGQNPYELYLTQAKTLSFIEVAFNVYKQNVIDWLSFASMRLGSRVLKFLNWVLTVDKTLYGNQPVVVKSRQLQVCKNESIICSMHMGSYRHTAVELFADSQNEAINLVKTLFDESLRNLQKGMTFNQAKCFSIMGYCLEWIRARENTHEILQHLARNTIRNPFWIDQNTIKNHSVIKFILSLVSIASQYLEPSEFKNIRGPILEIIHKFKEGKSQFEQSLIQELLSILISIPPQLEDTTGISQIVRIWKTQTNNEYFYNQSRLILELAEKQPNQIAKLKALRSCQKIKKAVSTSHYSYSLRFPDSISFVWGVKIASTLMSSEIDTVLIFEEISEFFNLKSDQIYNLLLHNTTTLTLVHIEELQALLEFILTLITSQSWVTVHRKQFEKLTYALSHKLMNTFMDFINSKISFVAESDMQKRFKKVKFETLVNQLNQQTQNHIDSSIDRNSVFRMLAQLKMIECIKTFTIVMSRCFEQSWYIHKYFNEEVYDNYRYGVSFWDRMNKCIMDLIRFNINIEKKWRKSQNLNQKLLLIQDCVNASEFFVQTGYLSSLYWIPSNAKQLFEEFEELNRLSLELGTIHLIQEKTFRQKYQCLMRGNIQKFGKKLLQNSKLIQSQSYQQELKQDKSIKPKGNHFIQSWQKNITHLIKTI